MTARLRIGLDVGGTKIEGAVIDESGTVRLRRRTSSPAGDYQATITAIVAIIGAIERDLGVTAPVGIGIPGAISPATGLVKNANSTWLIGRPLQRDLETALARPVRLANDANCFALSEATDGAAAGAETVFGVILGTGVGGGIAVNGQIQVGANAIAGEWGHNPLPWARADERPGYPCFGRHSGCIETFLSGPGLERDHLHAHGEALTAHEIATRAAIGDPACDATLKRYEERLARALAHVINILDPEVVVLGGGMSNVQRLYVNVPRLWSAWVFSDRVDTLLLRHRHGDSSGVRGAAWLGAAT
jgi:fructokinase